MTAGAVKGSQPVASVTYESVTKKLSTDSTAVDDLSLEIRDSEFMVLVGPSGCGKSTALRMLAGLEDITAGEIKIDDQVVNEMPPRDRDVAMVFQSYALYPHMSVFDNMGFGLKMRGSTRSEITSRVKEAGRILRLDQLLARKPRQLSGGQRQRVAVGRAIVRQPRVFLLDEPLSNLDAMLRVQTRIELQKMHQRLGTTFIYVTHDQVEAMTMGDRIAVMKDGVLQQVAPPREIYDQPVNMYVAGFIGSPRMNFLPVTISDHKAKASGFELDLPKAPGVGRGILGIRPEHFLPTVSSDDAVIDLKVEVLEILGTDQYLYGKVGSDDLIARVDQKPAHCHRLAGRLHPYVSVRDARTAGEEVEAHRARLFQVADAAVGHAAGAPERSEDGGVHLAPQRPVARRLVEVLHHHHARARHLAHVLIEHGLVAVVRPPAGADGCCRRVAHHRAELGKEAAHVHPHVALVPGTDREGLDGVAQGRGVEPLQRLKDVWIQRGFSSQSCLPRASHRASLRAPGPRRRERRGSRCRRSASENPPLASGSPSPALRSGCRRSILGVRRLAGSSRSSPGAPGCSRSRRASCHG